MASQNNRNQQQGGGLDLVTPFVEIFGEVVKLCIELLELLIKFLVQKFIEWHHEKKKGQFINEPIRLRQLEKRKVASLESQLGQSLNRRRPFEYSELNTSKHTGVIGSTGSGKSVCLENLMINSLRRGRPIIYFDPKPTVETLKRFRAMNQRYGKKAYVIGDGFFGREHFNPLLEGSVHEVTARIMNALEWSESFYKNESQRVLHAALKACEREQNITLTEIIKKIETHPERKSVSGLLSQLIALNESEFSENLNAESFNSLTLKQIRLEGASVYIAIPSMGKGSVGMMMNKLYFGALLNHSKESFNGMIEGLTDPLLKPMSVFFDELASVVHEGFIDLLNKCRAAGIEITFATQCPSDLDRISPEMTLQVFENTNNLFVFNQVVPAHTEFFAKLAGTKTSIKQTHMTEDGNRGSRGSEREVEEFIVHANIFRSLRVGQCVFIQRSPKRVDVINVKLPVHLNPEPQGLNKASSTF